MIEFRHFTAMDRHMFGGAPLDAVIAEVQLDDADHDATGYLICSTEGFELVMWSEDGETVCSYIHPLVDNVNTLLHQPITKDQLLSWDQII